MLPPPYTVEPTKQSSSPNGNYYEERLKIIVGLDYGTTNSGKSGCEM
jgi:hypothetical protein